MSPVAGAETPTAEATPESRSARHGIIAMYGLESFGTGAFTSVQIVFFTQVLDRSPEQTSTALSTASLVALAFILPFGRFADRFDRRLLLGLMNAAVALFLLGYVLPPSAIAFFVTTALVVLLQRLIGPIRAAVIAELFPVNRVALRAATYVAHNIGFSLGSLFAAGALLLVDGEGVFRTLLLINVATFAACVLIVLRLPSTRREPVEPGQRRGWAALKDRPFVVATIANTFGSLHDAALFVGLPLWLLHRTNGPGWGIPAIIALNCVLVVALQVRLSRGTDTVRDANRRHWHGTLVMAIGCALLVFTGGRLNPLSWTLLTAAVVLLTISEITQSAGAWGLSFNLADERRMSEYQSLFGFGLNVQEVIGPILVTALVLAVPHGLGWLVLAAIVLLPVGVATRLLHRWAPVEGTA
ncbi:MFS transporter [Micromonospora sp. LOL_025]|uniref:MFS transporter n=1 Tax=Micromonospora sp. LOL_025 TaxID=3345413 RepID=UPI003A8AA573